MPGHGDGPIPSRIMLVGEAWGEWEEKEGKPFVGPSGSELNRMLHEVGILRSECYTTNLINARPPDNYMGAWVAEKKSAITPKHVRLKDKMVLPWVAEGYRQLLAEIQLVQPNIIVAFGNYALWALTDKWGIMNWRGSHLQMPEGPKVIPTIHPASVLREWSQRAAVISDLRRVAREMHDREYSPPAWRFQVRPNFGQVMDELASLHYALESGSTYWFDLDIETRAGHIECISVSWSRLDALCVPIMNYDGSDGYWSADEEAEIVYALYKLFTHPNARCRAQNGLYDLQYIERDWLHMPRVHQDTMISQHSLFSDQPKALHYQASLYAKWYIYWKGEGKKADVKERPEDRWIYNCKDCVYTREVGEAELEMVENFKPTWPKVQEVHNFQQAMFWPVLWAMRRGVKVNMEARGDLADEVQGQISLREVFLYEMLGMHVNINSPKQMMALFYQDLAQPLIMTRAKKGQPAHPTCNDEALMKIGSREPLLRPITNCIADIRTLNKFLGDFILAKLDQDGRMRCSFNIGGSERGKTAPKTYRLSSSTNAFGGGANLQTIPSEKSKSVGKWMARRKEETINLIGDPYKMPNLRSMFAPDERKTFFDMDLSRADLYGMAWDAQDEVLKAVLKKDVDTHLFNVYVLDNQEPPPLEELVESHPKYLDHRGPRKHKREFAKVFCHATDYLGKSRTVAAATGRTVHEVERAQARYLGMYKGIKTWQDRVIHEVKTRRYVENAFGYRWYIFDRIDDSVMPEAVAWIPQSTVSIVINRIWMNLFQGVPEAQWDLTPEHMYNLACQPHEIEVLLQVHDSLAGQFPTHRKELCMGNIMELSKIIVPYDDPLIIPTGLGTSEKSWGEC